MRFHKSRKITAADAELLVQTSTSSLNATVVIAHNDDWYDVRLMTARELHDFVADLLRADIATMQSGLITPH